MTRSRVEEEWRRAEREAFDRRSDEVRLADAVAGMVATAAPIAVGIAAGHPHAGLVVGLGGLNVALSMGRGRPRVRAPWGLATLVLGSAVTGLATLVHPVGWLSVVLAFVVCGAGSVSRVLGREATLGGLRGVGVVRHHQRARRAWPPTPGRGPCSTSRAAPSPWC